MSRTSPSPPLTVWLQQSKHTGDFHNGLAVAHALSGTLRIIDNIHTADNPEGITVSYADEGERHLSFQEFPDIYINSGKSSSHILMKQAYNTCIKRQPAAGTGMLTVVVCIPDYLIRAGYSPQTDMHVIFRHQLEKGDRLETNMYLYDTVPSPVDAARLPQKTTARQAQSSPCYALLLGEQLNSEADLSDMQGLADKISTCLKRTGGSLLLSTSRRTQKEGDVIALFQEAAKRAGAHFFSYAYNQQQGKNNPYFSMLAQADKIIVTDDSLSMLSDVLAAGKPCFVHQRSHTQPAHERYFHYMQKKGLAHPVTDLVTHQAISAPINSAQQIAADALNLLHRKTLASPHEKAGIFWRNKFMNAQLTLREAGLFR